MDKTKEIIEYNLNHIDMLYAEESYEELADFLGTSICDGYCLNSTNCKQCALFVAYHKLFKEPTNENLNEIKALVCQKIHKKEDK